MLTGEDEVVVEALLHDSYLAIVGAAMKNTKKTSFLLVTVAMAVEAALAVAVASMNVVVEEEMMAAEEDVVEEKEAVMEDEKGVVMGQTSVSVLISSGKKDEEITGISNKGEVIVIKAMMKDGMEMTHGATIVAGMMGRGTTTTITNHTMARDVYVAEEEAEVVVAEDMAKETGPVLMPIEVLEEKMLKPVMTELNAILYQKEQEMVMQLQPIPLLLLRQPLDAVVVVGEAKAHFVVVGVTSLTLKLALHLNSGFDLKPSLPMTQQMQTKGGIH